MAGGYSHKPTGEAGVAKAFARKQDQLDTLRARSGVKNANLRGDVLTFQSTDGELTGLLGETESAYFNGTSWVADHVRGLELTKAGDTHPFAYLGHATGTDRVDVVLGFGETALEICYMQTGEFWVSGPGGSMFYIDPNGAAVVIAAPGQNVSLTGDDIDITGDTHLSGALEIGGDTELSGDLQVDGDVGFYGTAPTSQQNVTGAKGGNAALANLLTALENLGLINDSTSA